MQCGFVFGQKTLLQDFARALVQTCQAFTQQIQLVALVISALVGQRRIGVGGDQIGRRRRRRIVVVIIGGIEGDITAGQTRLHFHDVAFGYIQILGDRGHFGGIQPTQAFFRFAQVEEQLALGLGGGHFHDTPVAQDELMHLGAHPMHGETDQAHALVRIEAFDRFHQADIAFLDQIAHAQAIALVATGHMHDETQMRHHQMTGGFQVFVVTEGAGQSLFVFHRQHRYAVDRTDIGIHRSQRAGNRQAMADQGFAIHGFLAH